MNIPAQARHARPSRVHSHGQHHFMKCCSTSCTRPTSPWPWLCRGARPRWPPASARRRTPRRR
eukprot:6345153-Alexandrium_andersonii.AAC.1